jgi:uncharacterized protein YndB with AHSA1/START domain
MEPNKTAEYGMKIVDQNTLVIERIFDAPRGLVWKAWTDPRQMMRWWGPKHFTVPVCKMDLRVGEKYLFCMRSPDGQDFWSTGVFREIVQPGRLVFTDSFADNKGNAVPASHYGMEKTYPMELMVTVTLEEYGNGKTRLTLRHAGNPADVIELTGASWNESFDKLVETLRK